MMLPSESVFFSISFVISCASFTVSSIVDSYVFSIIAETFMLNGIIINITRPNAAIFAANIFKTVRLNPIPAANKTHAAGINIENVAYPVSVTKYFSKNITTRIIRKYDVKSVSLFAIGVVASPGIAAMAVDAAADVAVSFRISAFFSSSASIVFLWFSGLLAAFETTVIERTIITSATATHASFFTFFFSIIFSFPPMCNHIHSIPYNLTYFIIFFHHGLSFLRVNEYISSR